MIAGGEVVAPRAAPVARQWRPLPLGGREDVLHDSARTRVRRVWLPDGGTVVCKERLGTDAVDRASAEHEVLERLAGLPGIAHLAPWTLPGCVVVEDIGPTSLAEAIADGTLGGVLLDGSPAAMRLALALAHRLAVIVAGVHKRGIVHRDLNPSNVMLAGPDQVPVVIDFDLATSHAELRTGFSHHRDLAGTLAYLPPEQTGRTAFPLDQRADLYSLGAILYELVAGRPPFGTADDPLRIIRDVLVTVPVPLGELRPGAPQPLCEIVARLLEKEPDRRYASAEGLASDLSELLSMLRTGEPGGLRLGSRDFPARLVAPSPPLGRDREIATLLDGLDAAARRATLVVVRGPAGVGKSAVAGELRVAVAARGGSFVTESVDTAGRNASAGPVTRAIGALARLVLPGSEKEVEDVRRRLRLALGANADLLAAAVPDLALLLGTGDGATDPSQADPAEVAARLVVATVDAFGVLASPERPVVLALDDLHAADRTTVDLVDALLTAPDVRGLLLVGLARDKDPDTTEALGTALPRWEAAGAAVTQLTVEALPVDQLERIVAHMLRLPNERASSLAAALAPWAGGNPEQAVELLNALRHDDVLVLGPDGWTWDDDHVHEQLQLRVAGELTAERIGALPAASREVLQVLACLGPHARVDLLAAAAARSRAEVLALLGPASQERLVVACDDGETIAFRNERVHQAVYASAAEPPSATCPRLHRDLARRLAAMPDRGLAAAEQYLAAEQSPAMVDRPGEVVGDEELRTIAALHLEAGCTAARSGNHGVAERFLAAAAASWARRPETDPGDPDDPDDPGDPGDPGDTLFLVELETARHAVLYALGRLADADVLYASVVRLCADPVLLARAAGVQISSLSQRNRHRDAADLALALLARLGVTRPPAEAAAAAMPDRLADLVAWAGSLDLAGDLSRPEIDDPRLQAVDRLLSRVLPTAFFLGDKPLVAWIILTSQGLWARSGPSAGLAATLSCVGLVAMPLLGDFRIGHVVGRHVLAVSSARGHEPETSVLRHRLALHVMPWNEPLEQVIEQAQLAREGLLHGGDLQMANHTCLEILSAALDCAPTLTTYVAEIESALALAQRSGHDHTEQIVRAHHRFAQVMQAPVDGGARGNPFPPEQLAGIAANHLATGTAHALRAVAAAVFDDPHELARATADAVAGAPFVPGYPLTHITALRAVSLAEQLRLGIAQRSDDVVAELDRCRTWLAARARDLPESFEHLVHWVDGEAAWTDGRFQAAVEAFDAALATAASRQRPWHHALVAQRWAAFAEAHGLVAAAQQAVRTAYAQYRSWGAEAKAADLLRLHDHLRADRLDPVPGRSVVPSVIPARGTVTVPSAPVAPGGGTRSIHADSIDLLAVLRASQALSRETSIERLHAVVTEQLTTLTGATDVAVLLRGDDGTWSVPSQDGSGQTLLDDPAAAALVPLSALRYVERTGVPLLVDDATRDERFAADAYLAGMSRCALLVVPVLAGASHMRAGLVLANRHAAGAFTTDRLDAVLLVTGQLTVSLGNALLYASLEARVADRTQALESANRQLETLSGTDALTGLANRRRFDETLDEAWQACLRDRRPLSVVLVDIDHFKRYNDRYGHLAGDQCLRAVAAALATAARATDLVCRYGGEEFVIIVPGADVRIGRTIGERCREAVAALQVEHATSDTGLVTLSVGVAGRLPDASFGPVDFLDAADAALYRAKQSGRNQVQVAQAPSAHEPPRD